MKASHRSRCVAGVGLAVAVLAAALGARQAFAQAQGGPTVWTGADTWAFDPQPDRYSPDSLLDLRRLNEEYAGQHGFIRLSQDGGDFAWGDGTPAGFWAVNTSIWSSSDPAMLADHARFLAKRGVNMVRWHGSMPLNREGSRLTDIDERARDQLWRLVAAMKKEGIYVTMSPYYPHATPVLKSWGIDSPQPNMTCLLFFDPRVQEAYKGWLWALLTPPNPYTGIPLKDEPGVAIIQVQNEDSMLFWTIANVEGGERELLQHRFGEWLVRKYGSLEAASAAWQAERVEGDDLGRGLPGLYHIWEMTTDALARRGKPTPGKEQRLADQAEFFVETMRSWYAELTRFLRQEVGARQVINAGNWRTADTLLLDDLERYSYTATDVAGVNRYYNGGLHVGQNNGWAIVNGDKFSNRSVLLDPVELPVSLKQPAGHPIIIPESNWVPPLAYQSEGPFLVSVFQSLTGVDAFYWFNIGGMTEQRPLWPRPTAQWIPPASANGYMPSIGKWVADTPEVVGNFPAAALLYRMGYVQRGQPVVHERRSLQDMWHLRVPIISEGAAYDPNRDKGQYAPASNIKQDVNPLAFLVGPVLASYDADPSASEVADLSHYVDGQARVVRSITGEVEWDYGKGICTVNAPKAQGVTGFLKQVGTFRLSDAVIQSGNEYATVLVVSLDDVPLASSGSVLVQAGTIARPTGWAERPASWTDEAGKEQTGFEVVNIGRAPWAVVANDITVTLANAGIGRAVALDMNGLPRGQVELQRDGPNVTFRMPRDAKYLVLTR